MRTLLATSFLTPIAIATALPAAGQTVTISDLRLGEIRTSAVNAGQPADVVIAATGTVSNSSDDSAAGASALTVDSSNSATNNGAVTISGSGRNAAVTLDVGSAGAPQKFVNNGTLVVSESYQSVDSDNDGDLDGPRAQANFRDGIRVASGYLGDIVNGASGSITVQGNGSTGILTDGVVTGNIVNDGAIRVVGDFNSGILVGSKLDGDLHAGGTIVALGRSSSAVSINARVTGQVVISGDLTATGLRYTTSPADSSRLDDDDLLPSGPTVAISADVDKGVDIAAGGEVKSFGSGTAIDIGASEGSIAIGAGANGYAFSVGGNVLADGVFAGLDSNGVVVSQATLAGGMNVKAIVSARSVDATAVGIDLRFGAVVPNVVNSGTITASASGASGTAVAIAIGQDADVTAIDNSGTIAAIASDGARATAILGNSDALRTINNSGVITASGGTGPDGNRAIDLSGLTSGVSISQTNASPAGPAPAIKGNIVLGRGNDAIAIGAGSVAGDIDLRAGGDDTVTLSQNAALAGNILGGSTGSVQVRLAGGSSLIGNALLGDGSVILQDTAKFTGSISFAGAGQHSVRLTDASSLQGNVQLGGGTSTVQIDGQSLLVGDASFAGSGDRLTVSQMGTMNGNIRFTGDSVGVAGIGSAKLAGKIDFGAGLNAELGLGEAATFTGDVRYGGKGARLFIGDSARLIGNARFEGEDGFVTLLNSANFMGRLDFAGGYGTLTLGDSSRLTGSLVNAQQSVVNVAGGTLDLIGTPTVALRGLNVTDGGTLVVNINAGTLAATRFNVTQDAYFATGSKLLLHVDGIFSQPAHIVIVSAQSVTGGEHLTANDVAVPFLFRSMLTHTNTEVALDIVRKAKSDLGLNDSGSAAIDPIIIASASDPEVGETIGNVKDEDGLKRVVATLLPDHAGGIFEAVTGGSRSLERRLIARADRADRDHTALWLDTLYWSGNKDTGNSAGYRVSGWGYAAGGETPVGFGLLGASVAYLRGSVLNVDATANRITTDQLEAALYWHGRWGALRSFARLSESWIDVHSQRRFEGAVGTRAVTRLSSGKWGADLFSASAGASYEGRMGKFSLRPILAMEYYRLDERAHTDRGGGPAVDLAIARRTSDEFAANATMAFGATLGSVGTGWVRPEIEGGYRKVLDGRLGDTTARFRGGQPFTLLSEQRTDGWVGRFRLSGGKGGVRVAGEFSAEEQQRHTSLAIRGTVQIEL